MLQWAVRSSVACSKFVSWRFSLGGLCGLSWAPLRVWKSAGWLLARAAWVLICWLAWCILKEEVEKHEKKGKAGGPRGLGLGNGTPSLLLHFLGQSKSRVWSRLKQRARDSSFLWEELWGQGVDTQGGTIYPRPEAHITLEALFKRILGLPAGPVAKDLRSQPRGPGFDPRSGN